MRRVLLGLLVLLAVPARGQQTTVISGAPTCPNCRFELTRVRSWTKDDMGHLFVVKDRHGGYYFAGDGPAVYHFDSLGRRTQVGGRSLPPVYEVQGIRGLHVDFSDSLFVLGERQLVVFDPKGRAIRQSRAEFRTVWGRVLRLPSGEWLGSQMGQGGTPEQRAGLPIHLYSPDGQYVRSFAGRARPIEPGRNSLYYRYLQLASPSSFWSAHETKYQIDRWSLSGELLQSIVRNVDWFPEWTDSYFADLLDHRKPYKPTATMQDIHPRSPSEMWVLTRVPRSGYKPPSRRTQTHVTDIMESVLEVIDPIKGRLIASQRLPKTLLLRFIGHDEVYGMEQDEDGVVNVVVWRVRFIDPSAEQKR